MTDPLILNYGRCSHGKCSFCGYGRIRGQNPEIENINNFFDGFFEKYESEKLKVFGSGSFLDEKQMPAESRSHFIRACLSNGIKELTIESRPEYIKAEVLSEFAGIELTIAIGLEVADDVVLKSLNKGLTLSEYVDAVKKIHDAKAKVRTYLLVNPPNVDDIEKSLAASVEFAKKHSDSIVLINLLPHGATPIARLWLDGIWTYLTKKEFRDIVERYIDDPQIESDAETFKFTPAIPEHLQVELKGVGEWFLTHPHFEVWQDWLIRWYEPKKDQELIFLPCSFKKPYSHSKTHQGIIRALSRVGRNRFHEIMLSNAGLIPRQYEDRYPFNAYDWDEKLETESIKRRYVQITKERIVNYLKAHGSAYKRVWCFLKPSSESYLAVAAASAELGIEIKNLLDDDTYETISNSSRPLQEDAALNALERGLIEE